MQVTSCGGRAIILEFVFISYQLDDSKWSHNLKRELESYGIHAYLDKDELRGGETWEKNLRDALKISTHVVFIVTPRSTQSSWMAAELGAALAKHKSIVSVVAPSTRSEDIPGPLRSRQSIVLEVATTVAKQIAEAVK